MPTLHPRCAEGQDGSMKTLLFLPFDTVGNGILNSLASHRPPEVITSLNDDNDDDDNGTTYGLPGAIKSFYNLR